MARPSSGIPVYRRAGATAEFLLIHPGGPLWQTRDEGAWSIPKGLVAWLVRQIKIATEKGRAEFGNQLLYRAAFVAPAPKTHFQRPAQDS